MSECTKDGARFWRAPTEEDKARKCRARNPYEKRPFYTEWSETWGCLAIAGRPHILIAVAEILSPAKIKKETP